MSDAINPSHYRTESGLEAIDVIEAFDLGHHLACAAKYILRHGRKGSLADALNDIEKAIWYLTRYRTLMLRNSCEQPVANPVDEMDARVAEVLRKKGGRDGG